MKNRALVLEHEKMMFHSQELIQLKVPKEINIVFCTIVSVVFFVFGLLIFVKINDVVKVNGIVKTQLNNSTVKNILAGEIDKIFYHPDQYVEKGEILYSLKNDVYTTLLKDLDNEICNKREEKFCLDAIYESFNTGVIKVSKEDNLFAYSRLLDYFETIAYLEKQNEILEYKYRKEKNQPSVLYNKRNVDEAFLNYSLGQQELKKYKASFFAEIIERRKDCDLELEKLEQESIRLQEEYSFLDVKASVSGFIQEVASLNVGDYVFANQEVLIIIPNDMKNFRVELAVPQRDIGEITEGMKVKYRLSAFPFFEYKGAEGTIEIIDSDVRRGESWLYYRVYSDISRTSFVNNKGNEYPLRAGIEVDARIVMEKISIMHFILRKLDFMQ